MGRVAVGHSGLDECATGMGRVHPPLSELVELGQVGSIADRGNGDAQQDGLPDHFLGGASRSPLPDGAGDGLTGGNASPHGGYIGIVGPLGVADQHGEVLPLLAGEHTEPHVTVASGLHRRNLQHRPGVVVAGKRTPQRLHIGAGRGDGLQQGEVHVVTDPGALSPAQRGHSRHRSGHTAHPFPDAASGVEGSVPRLASGGGRPGDGHERELVGRTLAPGAASTKVGHRQHGGVGSPAGKRFPAQPQSLQLAGLGPLHHQFGGCVQIEQVIAPFGSPVVQNHTPLGGVQESEQRTVVVDRGEGGRIAPQRIAVGQFHLHHIGPGVGEQFGGITAGDAPAQVDHPNPV